MKHVAVVGGGASGHLAAYFAALNGNRVVLFEKQKKLGRKLLATGNGRCNITNRNIALSNYHGRNPKFVLNVFSRFGLRETEHFFNNIGLPLVEENHGRMFPASFQASSVTGVLLYELKKLNVDIKTHRKVVKIGAVKGMFKIITAGKEEYSCQSVILSAGNCSYPQLGGTKVGIELVEELGHRIVEPFPAILPVNIPLKSVHRLQGVKWKSSIAVLCKGKIISSTEGELLFTGFGLSGTAALDISRSVNENIIKGKSPEIVIDFFPQYSYDELFELFQSIWADSNKKLSFSMTGIINSRIPEVVLGISGIDPDRRINELNIREKKEIVKIFKCFKLTPGKPRPFSEAVVAAGGVDVSEINPATMESRIVKNLFITGELLDIDGDSGGYNLQFAWSTGAIAGMSQ